MGYNRIPTGVIIDNSDGMSVMCPCRVYAFSWDTAFKITMEQRLLEFGWQQIDGLWRCVSCCREETT